MGIFGTSYDENRIVHIPITNILPSPYQPRSVFDGSSLRELAQSIKSYGVLQPITVRVINGRTYELVTGERRWRAAKMAALTSIPAIIVNVNDRDAALMTLIKSLNRQNLNLFEEAEGYRNIMEDYDLTAEDIAIKTGKSPAAITQKLRLLYLPENIRRLITENGLSEGHARAFLRIPDTVIMEEAVHKAIDEGLSVKNTEKLVDSTLKSMRESGADVVVKKKFGDVRIINNTVKKAVELIKKSGVEADYSVEQTDDSFKIVVTIPFK